MKKHPSLILSLLLFFCFCSFLHAQPTTYSPTDSYIVGDLVVSGIATYIAIEESTGQSPTNTTYWTDLSVVATALGIPVEVVPTMSTSDLLALMPKDPPPDANSSSGSGSNTNLDPLASGLLSSTNEAFIRQQYVDFFGRKADNGGIDYYNEKFNGGYTKAELVNEFVFSTEFQEKIAPVSRLYLAYFLRIPDTAGLEYWINQKLNGWSLEVISSAFAESAEFNNRYGALNNADFIRLVYQNIFSRSADVAGFNYYLNLLDSGNLSRGAMMTSISESTENKATSLSEVRIISFYYGMLRRTPEQGGYDFWVAALDAGTEPKTLLDDFINSAEYQARF